jgi:hypothetical protein
MYYLAYGSNLHPHRLSLRISSAQHVGNVELPGQRLSFDKRSRDGSSKCMFVETGARADVLHGALFRIDPAGKSQLDAIEGVGKGYDEHWVRMTVDGSTIEAFTYTAASTHIEPTLLTFDWYKELVILGAEYHRFPDTYVDAIREIPVIPDADRNRRRRIGSILEEMRRMNSRNHAAF